MTFWEFFMDRLPDVMSQTLRHLQITGISVAFAIVVGIPLGIYITRNRHAAKYILGVANIFQTLPSLALFGLLIPLLGIGIRLAVFVLFLYALLPIIKNTYTGIIGVDSAILEAGKGMGMTSRQLLTMVEIPLALPIMMAGIRISTVINIGTATIAALIGAGGLGSFIFRGISIGNNNLILIGAIPAALLALFVDWLLGVLEYRITPKGIR
ncbi:osmoprotectant transport system permease protein [Natronincola peptidivorans]|uniref:Osmoprotectant transport system permease protein n=1 Tax=Natronincola peptidivorans TaxID=426128 RepID=A0A1I0DBP4_9FIRM|nr:ABC transporter permease [Natronincola peptidivorans]SET29718.1 osmoprotectant transport system permease protein [Natronincola peptidivorans]